MNIASRNILRSRLIALVLPLALLALLLGPRAQAASDDWSSWSTRVDGVHARINSGALLPKGSHHTWQFQRGPRTRRGAVQVRVRSRVSSVVNGTRQNGPWSRTRWVGIKRGETVSLKVPTPVTCFVYPTYAMGTSQAQVRRRTSTGTWSTARTIDSGSTGGWQEGSMGC